VAVHAVPQQKSLAHVNLEYFTLSSSSYPCPRFEDGKDEDDKVKYSRFTCAKDFCCGTAWTATVDEDDTLVDGASFHVKNDPLK
jgi:hypothetical protein